MKRAHWLVIAASYFVGACAAITEPTRPAVEFSVTSESRGADANPTQTLSANAASGHGTIVVMGRIRTSTPCWNLEQHVTRVANSIDVTIAAHEVPGICAQVLLARDYTLRLNSLAPGSYVVKVAHEHTALDGRTWREAVLEKDVHVD